MAKYNPEATKELSHFIINNRSNGITVDNFEKLKTILGYNPDPNIEVKGGMGNRYSLLDLIFINRNYEHVEFVLKYYYLNIDCTIDEKGNNMVLKACKENRADILRAIEDSGKTHLDYNKANNKGETPLLLALKHSKECLILLLKDPCIKLNYQFKNLNDGTLLHILCNESSSENLFLNNDHNEIFDILINQSNLDLNLKDSNGCTSLMIAVKNNNIRFVEAIMNYKSIINDKKVDISVVDILGKKAIDYAQNPEIIKLLGYTKREYFMDKLMKLLANSGHDMLMTENNESIIIKLDDLVNEITETKLLGTENLGTKNI